MNSQLAPYPEMNEELIEELKEYAADFSSWGPPELAERICPMLLKAADALAEQDSAQPIEMILCCPNCGKQHIDEPQPEKGWTNPPHRSHECQGCGHVWRPADVPTTGVAAIKTQGKRDGSPFPVQDSAQPVTEDWANEAASCLARFISLWAHPDEDEWGLIAVDATRILNNRPDEFPVTDSAQPVAETGVPHPEVTPEMVRAAYDNFIEGVESLEPPWEEVPQSHRDRLKDSIEAALSHQDSTQPVTEGK